jgi:hypothetical protein
MITRTVLWKINGATAHIFPVEWTSIKGCNILQVSQTNQYGNTVRTVVQKVSFNRSHPVVLCQYNIINVRL